MVVGAPVSGRREALARAVLVLGLVRPGTSSRPPASGHSALCATCFTTSPVSSLAVALVGRMHQ